METAKGNTRLKFCRKTTGGQGVHREVGSEGFEEYHRVVVEGGHPTDERVGQREGMVVLAPWRRKHLDSPLSYQGVCRRHGEEEQCVTQGGLTVFSSGIEISETISASEVISEVLSVVGQSN